MSEVYHRYLDDYGDSLGSTSGTWMTTVKSEVYQWYVNKYVQSLKSTSGIRMTIAIVRGLPVVYGWLWINPKVYHSIWMTIGYV